MLLAVSQLPFFDIALAREVIEPLLDRHDELLEELIVRELQIDVVKLQVVSK